MAVDAEAAQVFDRIVRDRWWRATGREIPASGRPPRLLAQDGREAWRATPGLTNAARVRRRHRHRSRAHACAPVGDEPDIREVEAMHLDMINAARRLDLHRESVLHFEHARRSARRATARAARARRSSRCCAFRPRAGSKRRPWERCARCCSRSCATRIVTAASMRFIRTSPGYRTTTAAICIPSW